MEFSFLDFGVFFLFSFRLFLYFRSFAAITLRHRKTIDAGVCIWFLWHINGLRIRKLSMVHMQHQHQQQPLSIGLLRNQFFEYKNPEQLLETINNFNFCVYFSKNSSNTPTELHFHFSSSLSGALSLPLIFLFCNIFHRFRLYFGRHSFLPVCVFVFVFGWFYYIGRRFYFTFSRKIISANKISHTISLENVQHKREASVRYGGEKKAKTTRRELQRMNQILITENCNEL